jgi:hypothetical protein
MDVRESGPKRLAGITNNNGLQIDLSMFLGRRELATGPWMIANPLVDKPRQPPLASEIQCIDMSERRRIVAQVRRKVPKNRDFFAD